MIRRLFPEVTGWLRGVVLLLFVVAFASLSFSVVLAAERFLMPPRFVDADSAWPYLASGLVAVVSMTILAYSIELIWILLARVVFLSFMIVGFDLFKESAFFPYPLLAALSGVACIVCSLLASSWANRLKSNSKQIKTFSL
jgi:hypothetical protein